MKSPNFQVLHVISRKKGHFYAYFLTTLNNVVKEYIMKVIATYALFCCYVYFILLILFYVMYDIDLHGKKLILVRWQLSGVSI